ncbi:MAG: hypothetical protein ACXWI6_18665 [Burkholderiales bacterium]
MCLLKQRARCGACTLTGLLLAGATFVCAQQPMYPTKPIRLIASQAPGGGVDAVARIVATRLAEALGQTVIVVRDAGITQN